ncbi:MAG: EAL domain-containing protein [Sulfuricaulis sp.]|nr:EAL domain-containing protein [Sulfuricaulis sp.]
MPVKITVIVYWAEVIVGLIICAFLLNGLEQRLANEYEANADRFAYQLEQLVRNQSGITHHHVAEQADTLRRTQGLSGVTIDLGHRVIVLGQQDKDFATTIRTFNAQVGTEPAATMPVKLTVFQPNIEQAVKQKRRTVVASMAFVLFIFGLFLIFILRLAFTKPFMRMVRTAQSVSDGNTAVRFDSARRDEFGYLASFINRILDHLQTEHHAVMTEAFAKIKKSQTDLFQEKERAQVTLHSIGDGVISTDVHGNVDYLNPTAERITGWSWKQALGQPITRVIGLEDEATQQPASNPVMDCLQAGAAVGPHNHLLQGHVGRDLAVSTSAAPMHDGSGRIVGAVMVLHDISEARRMSRQLSHQASHDELTGLYNRREFDVQLQHALNDAKRENHTHVLCYLDLDQFKVINDTCGHVAGDEMLRQVSDYLRKAIRNSDVIARLGGDEFGILLKFCPLDRALPVAEDLVKKVKKFNFVWQGVSFETGVSVGMVAITADSENIAELLSAADVACYAAKDEGRNRLHVYQLDDKELQLRHGEMHWVSRIRRAFEEDRFCLYCQAIVPIKADGKGTDYEILMRMRDEHGQLVPPMAFIPAAERYHLMPEIDRWVVRKAFESLGELLADEDIAMCSINLSGQSIGDPNFLDFIVEQIAHFNVDPRKVCFEITETAAIANLLLATHFISELKAMGCRFALDDFGKGLSSFSYLKNLNIDYLKIDGGFVKDMVSDPIDHAMVEAINQIGHVMGIQTIAEFVENEQILDALRKIGVDFAQGYGIAKPCPLETLLTSMDDASVRKARA